MKEQWKQIKRYPAYYVSSEGRVWPFKTKKFLNPARRNKDKFPTKSSYLTVVLRGDDNKSHACQVHRLVAEEFLPKPVMTSDKPRLVVRHLNGNETDNRVENLAWGTDKDNTGDTIGYGKFHYASDDEREKGRHVIRDPVLVRNRSTNQKILYESLTAAAKACHKTIPSLSTFLRSGSKPNKRSKFSAEYLLRSDRIMNHINCFPEYHYEEEIVNGHLVKHNWFRGVDLGLGGYIVGNVGMYEDPIVLLDIQSMHPSSIIALNLFGEHTDRFKEIVDARIAIKHGDYEKAKTMLGGALAPFLDDPAQAKALSNALKLAINSVYGQTYQDYEGNPFHDKRNRNNIVALRGAIFMKMLEDEMTARGVKVIAIRTDSIKLLHPSHEDVDFAMEFAKKYSYSFEFEAVYDRMCLTTKSDYIAKYMDSKNCERLYGWIPKENEEHGGEWTSTAAFFSRPYVFKTLFSHEEITFKDLCETKEVKSPDGMFLDLNEDLVEGEHNYVFVGKVGSFIPIKPGAKGGELVVKRGESKYDAVNGTSGYRWLQSELVKLLSKEDDIDMSYFHNLADKVIDTISQYGDFEHFVGDHGID